MSPLAIQIDSHKTAFLPGESLRGVIRWQYEGRPGRLELRLIWFTRCMGTDDVGVVDSLVLEDPAPGDARAFHFRIPAGPYTYDGHIFKIRWALEFLRPGQNDCERLEFIVSPSGQPITFPSLPNRGRFGISIDP